MYLFKLPTLIYLFIYLFIQMAGYYLLMYFLNGDCYLYIYLIGELLFIDIFI